MAWTSPRTWVAGETVTAAIMNTHVRDNLTALFPAIPLSGVGGSIGGSPPTFNSGLFVVQAASDVVTYVTGGVTHTFPAAFPTGLLTVIPTPGDVALSFAQAQVVAAGSTASGFKFKAYNNAGTEIANSSTIRVNWLAIGW